MRRDLHVPIRAEGRSEQIGIAQYEGREGKTQVTRHKTQIQYTSDETQATTHALQDPKLKIQAHAESPAGPDPWR